jgi:hypothetical protein
MGNSPSIQKINFEDMQEAVFEEKNKYAIINTMSLNKQECLIKQTIPCKKETDFINTILKEGYDRGGTTTTDRFPCLFILYGENATDETVYKKYEQLISLGITNRNIMIYSGGMFEWLLLQDIYGDDEFPTTTKELDILKYKGVPAKYYLTM